MDIEGTGAVWKCFWRAENGELMKLRKGWNME
jgi:hypothetical protein